MHIWLLSWCVSRKSMLAAALSGRAAIDPNDRQFGREDIHARLYCAVSSGPAWAKLSVPTPKAKTAPMTDAPAISQDIAAQTEQPGDHAAPVLGYITSASTAVLLAAWKS
jgi:hypothetical protein